MNRYALTCCLTAGFLALAGCQGVQVAHSDPAPALGGKHPYIYYTGADVYYATDRGVYFWRDGGRWKMGELPKDVNLYWATGVSIELDTATPYEQHASVSSQYSDIKPRSADAGLRFGQVFPSDNPR